MNGCVPFQCHVQAKSEELKKCMMLKSNELEMEKLKREEEEHRKNYEDFEPNRLLQEKARFQGKLLDIAKEVRFRVFRHGSISWSFFPTLLVLVLSSEARSSWMRS